MPGVLFFASSICTEKISSMLPAIRFSWKRNCTITIVKANRVTVSAAINVRTVVRFLTTPGLYFFLSSSFSASFRTSHCTE